MDSKSLEPVLFQIKRVKDISFSVNETIFKPNTEIKFTLDRELKYKIEDNMVFLILSCVYNFPDIQEPVVKIVVFNGFEVTDLKRFYTNDLRLPQDLIISMVSMSISHTRALLCNNLGGTLYQDVMLPIINPVEITKHFFKEWFIESVDNNSIKELKKSAKKLDNEIKGKAKIIRKKS